MRMELVRTLKASLLNEVHVYLFLFRFFIKNFCDLFVVVFGIGFCVRDR